MGWGGSRAFPSVARNSIRKSLTNPDSSFRRKPESRNFNELDPGFRRGDEYFGVSLKLSHDWKAHPERFFRHIL